MTNKVVMGKVGFNFPVALSLIHYVTSWLLMAIFKALSLLPASPPSKTTPFSSLFVLGAVMAMATGLANASLLHNRRISNTFSFSCLIEAITLAFVSIGVAVATITDLQFNFFGACVALAWIAPGTVNKILWSNVQQTGNWTALALMWKTSPITIFFLVVLMPLLDPPGVLSFCWTWNNASAIIISALFGFLLQWSGALALGATSAVSHVVLGQFKTCVIMLGGYVFFNSDPGMVSLSRAVAALCGMSFYTFLNLLGVKQTSEVTKSALSKQNSIAAKPKTIIEEDEVEKMDSA